jgi:hypothetical protein
MALNLPTIGFRLNNAEAGGMPDLQDAMQKGFKSAYMPGQLAENLLQTQIANRLESAKVPYADRMAKANLEHMLAQTGHLGAQTNSLNIGNRTLGQRYQEQLTAAQLANMSKRELEKLYKKQPALRLPNLPPEMRGIAALEAFPDLLGNNSSPASNQVYPSQNMSIYEPYQLFNPSIGTPNKSNMSFIGQPIQGQGNQQPNDRQLIKNALIRKLQGLKQQAELTPSGDLRNQEYLLKIEKEEPEGKNSQRYIDAKTAFETEKRRKQIAAERAEKLTNTQDTRDLSTMGKQHREGQIIIKEGKNPATGEPLTPEEQKEWGSHYDAKNGNLKPGYEYIYDKDTGEKIGDKSEPSENEKKEIRGRLSFNYLQPIVTDGLNEYSGKGSWTKYAYDAAHYKTNEASRNRIDKFLRAKNLLFATTVKDDAALGGANTNQVYNRMLKSLDSSDIKPIMESIAQKHLLPSEAFKKASVQQNLHISKASDYSINNIPARIMHYYDPAKQRSKEAEEAMKVRTKAEPPPAGRVWGYWKDPVTNEVTKLPIPKKDVAQFIEDGGSLNG